jgi:hypothetical protein
MIYRNDNFIKLTYQGLTLWGQTTDKLRSLFSIRQNLLKRLKSYLYAKKFIYKDISEPISNIEYEIDFDKWPSEDYFDQNCVDILEERLRKNHENRSRN